MLNRWYEDGRGEIGLLKDAGEAVGLSVTVTLLGTKVLVGFIIHIYTVTYKRFCYRYFFIIVTTYPQCMLRMTAILYQCFFHSLHSTFITLIFHSIDSCLPTLFIVCFFSGKSDQVNVTDKNVVFAKNRKLYLVENLDFQTSTATDPHSNGLDCGGVQSLFKVFLFTCLYKGYHNKVCLSRSLSYSIFPL